MVHKNLTEEIKAAGLTMEFAVCPVCSDQAVVRLPDDWQEQKGIIPIVGCGNPWHYAISSLGDSPE